MMKNKLFDNLTQILFFPSWSKLLGDESFLGNYLNQSICDILKDNVILLPDLILIWLETTPRGEVERH